ncbi:hypothetical protein DMP17_05495 [Pseudonocardia sp. TMWB2A]
MLVNIAFGRFFAVFDKVAGRFGPLLLVALQRLILHVAQPLCLALPHRRREDIAHGRTDAIDHRNPGIHHRFDHRDKAGQDRAIGVGGVGVGVWVSMIARGGGFGMALPNRALFVSGIVSAPGPFIIRLSTSLDTNGRRDDGRRKIILAHKARDLLAPVCPICCHA